MWDKDEESKKMCELTIPAIRENYYKFDNFYTNRFYRTPKKYTSQNFDEAMKDEELIGFVCGSDTIFCMDEFGFDDGFYANYASMKEYVEELAKKNGYKIVEISLRATNTEKGHRMFYEAGIEEFLSLVKHAEYVVTNSFHGMIFAVQYRRPFVIFSREQCNTKIDEILQLFGLSDHMLVTGKEEFKHEINYDLVHERISKAREKSIEYLNKELKLLENK